MAKNPSRATSITNEVNSHLLIGNKCTMDRREANSICVDVKFTELLVRSHTKAIIFDRQGGKFKHYGQLNSTFGQLGNLQAKDVGHRDRDEMSDRGRGIGLSSFVTRCKLERPGNDWGRRANSLSLTSSLDHL